MILNFFSAWQCNAEMYPSFVCFFSQVYYLMESFGNWYREISCTKRSTIIRSKKKRVSGGNQERGIIFITKFGNHFVFFFFWQNFKNCHRNILLFVRIVFCFSGKKIIYSPFELVNHASCRKMRQSGPWEKSPAYQIRARNCSLHVCVRMRENEKRAGKRTNQVTFYALFRQGTIGKEW